MALTISPEVIPLRADSDGVIRVGGTRVTLDTVIASLPGRRDGRGNRSTISFVESCRHLCSDRLLSASFGRSRRVSGAEATTGRGLAKAE